MALTVIKNLDLTSSVTGTLPVASGGTGLTSGTTDQFLKFTGTTTLASSVDNGGKIHQIQHSKNTTYKNINSVTFNTCMSVGITPSASDSTILILGSPNISKDTNNTAVVHRCFRVIGGSDVETQVLSDHAGRNNSSSVYNDIGYAAFQWYDSPSTTSAITYEYRICSYGDNANVAFNNYSAGGSFSSQITAIEFLA